MRIREQTHTGLKHWLLFGLFLWILIKHVGTDLDSRSEQKVKALGECVGSAYPTARPCSNVGSEYTNLCT